MTKIAIKFAEYASRVVASLLKLKQILSDFERDQKMREKGAVRGLSEGSLKRSAPHSGLSSLNTGSSFSSILGASSSRLIYLEARTLTPERQADLGWLQERLGDSLYLLEEDRSIGYCIFTPGADPSWRNAVWEGGWEAG